MKFTHFTPFEYVLINLANHFGLDKKEYDYRINFMKTNMDNLESMVEDADEPELFYKNVLELRKMQAGKPVGTLVSFDSVCSGIQILSALTRCKLGAVATGLINTGNRPNAYLMVQLEMERIMGREIEVTYKDIKQAVMTSCYGSQAVPKALFEGRALDAFHEACQLVAPGAFNMLPVLRDTWDPQTKVHEWYLPDGYKAFVPVMDSTVVRIEIDELEGYKMSTLMTENVCLDKGLANIANIVHSLDAFVLRCLVRYCSYDTEAVIRKRAAVMKELANRDTEDYQPNMEDLFHHVNSMQWVDITLLDTVKLKDIPSDMLQALASDLERMLKHKSFEVVPVHDCFSCHPNNMDVLRMWYNEILARMSESTILAWILGQMYDDPSTTLELFPEPIGDLIRQANYAIC